ncbi:MAG: ParB/RepB/Spo0J family partition protein [Bryobacterales bacterium]|nr:ParB/RepB/Spo0J family partition protein [Bryobacterales bacterium]
MNKPHESRRRALGKGLTALLPTRPPAAPSPLPQTPAQAPERELPIDLIDPNPVQPRHVFQPERLEELAQSIRANGIIQPLVVRRCENRYQLVAGERRWRAAKLAGLERVPAIVQDVPDAQLLEITLIENIQREDLNPIEAAMAFARLSTDLQLTHEEIARRTGKDRTTITNLLRLLQLPEDVQQLVSERRISQGHARAILGLPTRELQREIAERTVAKGFSVRQVEQLVRRATEPRQAKSPEDPPPLDPNVKAAIVEMERALGTRVRIVEKGNHKGRIEIEYYSADDLDRIYATIVGPEEKSE